jgi:hypothetical protein
MSCRVIVLDCEKLDSDTKKICINEDLRVQKEKESSNCQNKIYFLHSL